jgi:hypothetical protein
MVQDPSEAAFTDMPANALSSCAWTEGVDGLRAARSSRRRKAPKKRGSEVLSDRAAAKSRERLPRGAGR